VPESRWWTGWYTTVFDVEDPLATVGSSDVTTVTISVGLNAEDDDDGEEEECEEPAGGILLRMLESNCDISVVDNRG